ncbi:hypothetical protein J4422_01570 [Candidatus Pacearchaeota archaeon]|nr:hypothetical protein [Candidatus Pacearchaeota archaeon]
MKNPKVVFLSFLALVFVILTFAIDWLFIIPAVVLIFINQRELMKNRRK